MPEDLTPIRRAVLDVSDTELAEVVGGIRGALEGDSNDAEHDALVDVAYLFGLDWTAEGDEDDES